MPHADAFRDPAPRPRPALVITTGVAAFAAVAAFVYCFDAPWTLRGDNKSVLFPMSLAAYRAWVSGHAPEWSNGLWAGFPLLADPESAALYWPDFLFFLLTPDPHLRAYDLSTAFHAGILVAGTVRLLLMLGASRVTAVFGGVLVLLAPFHHWFAAAIITVYRPLPWWPWIWGAAEGLAQAPSGRGAAHLITGWVALGTVALLFPEFALYSGVVAVCWILTRRTELSGTQRILRAALLVGGALALAAPQLVPTSVYQAETLRSGPLSTDLAAFVHLQTSLWHFLQPGSAAHAPAPAFVGPTALMLALVALTRRGPRVIFLWVVALVALFMALGLRTPVYEVVHALPLFNRFRQPIKFVPVLELAVACLAALGADTLWRKKGWCGVGALAAALMLIAVAERIGYDAVRLSGGSHLPGSKATSFAALYDTLLQSGLLAYAQGQDRLPPPRVLDTVHLQSLTMLHDIESLTGGPAALLSTKHYRALQPLISGPLAKTWQSPTRAQLDLYGVHLLLTRGPFCGVQASRRGSLELLEARERTCLFANPSRPPRYAFVDHVRAVGTVDEMIDLVKAEPAGPIPIVAQTDEIAAYLKSPASGRVEVAAYRPGRVHLNVETSTPRLLLVRESLVNGWHVRIDDEAVPLYPAAALFFAVPVPAGQHEVRLEYRAPGFRAGLLIAAFWLVGAGALWRAGLGGSRRG